MWCTPVNRSKKQRIDSLFQYLFCNFLTQKASLKARTMTTQNVYHQKGLTSHRRWFLPESKSSLSLLSIKRSRVGREWRFTENFLAAPLTPSSLRSTALTAESMRRKVKKPIEKPSKTVNSEHIKIAAVDCLIAGWRIWPYWLADGQRSFSLYCSKQLLQLAIAL